MGVYENKSQELKVNISGYSRQLPTVILYKNGVEQKRFPDYNEEGKIGKVLKYDVDNLEKYFGFKHILME